MRPPLFTSADLGEAALLLACLSPWAVLAALHQLIGTHDPCHATNASKAGASPSTAKPMPPKPDAFGASPSECDLPGRVRNISSANAIGVRKSRPTKVRSASGAGSPLSATMADRFGAQCGVDLSLAYPGLRGRRRPGGASPGS